MNDNEIERKRETYFPYDTNTINIKQTNKQTNEWMNGKTMIMITTTTTTTKWMARKWWMNWELINYLYHIGPESLLLLLLLAEYYLL